MTGSRWATLRRLQGAMGLSNWQIGIVRSFKLAIARRENWTQLRPAFQFLLAVRSMDPNSEFRNSLAKPVLLKDLPFALEIVIWIPQTR